jgi:TolB protein
MRLFTDEDSKLVRVALLVGVLLVAGCSSSADPPTGHSLLSVARRQIFARTEPIEVEPDERWCDGILYWSVDRERVGRVLHPGGSLWIAKSDGTNATPILTTRRAVWEFVWSPIGDRIVLTMEPRIRALTNPDVFLLSPDGSDLTRVTRTPSVEAGLSWSPDGGRVAFTRQRGEWVHLFVMDLDEGEEVHLGPGTNPSWSPDGRYIVYSSPDPTATPRSDLFVVRPDGSGRAKLTSGSQWGDYNAQWSPDGSKILFERYPADQSGEFGPFADLWVLSSTGITRLTSRQSDDSGVQDGQWSPDGRFISYQDIADDFNAIRIANADGSDDRAIAFRGGLSSSADWAPDSRHMVFADGGGLAIGTNRGKREHTLRPGPINDPDWAPC